MESGALELQHRSSIRASFPAHAAATAGNTVGQAGASPTRARLLLSVLKRARRLCVITQRLGHGFAPCWGNMEPLDQDLTASELELADDPMLLNVGPAHPATHGTVR